MHAYWISVLIPAYEYPDGILRILDLINAANDPLIECIISDDSLSESVKKLVFNHDAFKNSLVKYRCNSSREGAVNNWNSLLDEANGEYIYILHHDECPVGKDFFERLKHEIKNTNYEFYVLSCYKECANGYAYRHSPFWLTKGVINIIPFLLLHHNLIGSPSNFVVKKCCVNKFDSNLAWLVDVDWFLSYFIDNKNRFRLLSSMKVVSYSNINSITSLIKSRIDELFLLEFLIISTKFNNVSIFISNRLYARFFVRITSWVISVILILNRKIFPKKRIGQ